MSICRFDNETEVEVLGGSQGASAGGFTEKEILAALIAVEDILGAEGFLLGEKFEVGYEPDNGFYLHALDGEYPGDTAYKRYPNLEEVLAQAVPAQRKAAMGESALILIENRGYLQGLLRAITPGMRMDMKDKYYGADEESLKRCEALLNEGPEAAYFGYDDLGRQDFDALGYLVDRAIAAKIMGTQSAYQVIEYNGQLCEVYVDRGDISDFADEIENGTLLDYEGHAVWAFDSYRELIDAQKEMILEDLRDMALYEVDGSWEFYLSENELRHIGLANELAQAKAQEGVDGLVANAKGRTGGEPARGQEKEVEMD